MPLKDVPLKDILRAYNQVRDKPQSAVIVITGIMVKASHTVRRHIWYHCQYKPTHIVQTKDFAIMCLANSVTVLINFKP